MSNGIDMEFRRLLEGVGDRLGRQFAGDLDDVQAYASERMLHLSAILDQPGYGEALVAERDNVALRAGIAAVETADAVDREVLGTIAGALAIGARALAGA